MNKLDRPVIYVIDDDIDIQNLLFKFFDSKSYSVKLFSTAMSAMIEIDDQYKNLERCEGRAVIVCDVCLPGLDGLMFFEALVKKKFMIPIIFLTGHGSVGTAVEVIKKGASDYILKPVNLRELSAAVVHSFEQQSSVNSKPLVSAVVSNQMIGNSPQMTQVLSLIERVSKSISNVLITGESGTGKELVARLIHQNGDRSQFPFVAINCSAIPDQLLESELFGHRKGAFTGANESRIGLFEEAKGGTIFLDEIGDMPLGLQAKILRVLQEKKMRPVGENKLREIDVRILAATHKDPQKMIKDGKFREDLFYRICVIPIVLPALRERREDIPMMVSFFINKHCQKNSVTLKKLTQAALTKILQAPWPGNVRELENALERAIVLSESDWIEAHDILIRESTLLESHLSGVFTQLVTLQELERSYIRYVLDMAHHSKEKTAEILGINRKTLYRKEVEYGFLEV